MNVYRNKTKGTAWGMPAGLAIGLLISLIITFAGSAATAYLVLGERMGENGIGYASLVILFVSSVMGAWGAVNCIKRQRLQVCLLSAAVYYLSLIAMTAMFFGGQYQGMGFTAIVVVIGVLAVAFFPAKEGRKFRIKKGAYR